MRQPTQALKGRRAAPENRGMEERSASESSGALLRQRVLGAIALAGALLALVTVLMPPGATGSDALVLVGGGVAALAGVVLLLARRRLSEVVLSVAVMAGTALITLSTYQGGSDGTGTADNEMLYAWVCLYAFYFLSLRAAIVQLIGIAGAYAWLLSAAGVPTDEALTRLVVTLGTLLVAGLIIGRLRGSLNRLFEQLEARARHDSLTGLLNRRALEERASVEFARSRRDGGPVAMLVADLDGFKELNDSLGHPAGDQLLIRIASVLDAETRAVDAVGRIGGDEFAVLLPGATSTAARATAERLRLAVKLSAKQARVGVTLSIGIAVAPPAAHTLDELWQAADRAMYQAKRAGGDRVGVDSDGGGEGPAAQRSGTVLVER
jgi:diguanylate cyclase (GGDEF)-like protein